MREGTRAHWLSIFCTFWCLGRLHIDAKNEGNQQTFVVRYKNGEHTVPVTVVLDYKKQTEYVINMSPRAASKTVTLYDFKQKTIAYKDLTNRECFLGRLTDESLSEETDALTNIESPVERRPKVLSLDPHRTSLTPTEIRNMAGQKTAVFCGKMNTWLVLPRETHNIQKREADEVEERTFHRHGYHTVRYSHFGRETRRRYRNPANRELLQRRTAGNAETTSEKSTKPLESPSIQHQVLNPSPLDVILNGHNREVHDPEPPAINGKEVRHRVPTLHPTSFAGNWNSGKTVSAASQPNGSNVQNKYELHHVPTLHPASFTGNWNSGKTVSAASQANGPNGQNEYELQLPFNPTVIETPNYEVKTEGRANDRGQNLSNLKDANIVNGAFANGDASSVSSNPNYPVVPSILHNSETKQDSNQQTKINPSFNLNRDHRQTGGEDQFIPFNNDLNASGRKFYPKASDGRVILDGPDVSSNVLEIPQITKKSESIGRSLDPPQIVQPNEDVHDVFEGFFNLRNNNPPSEQLLYNSYFIPPEPNGGREHNYPQESLINSYPSFPLTRINNDTDKKQQRRENELDISKIEEVITSTDHPSLTTNSYSNYNGATISPTYWNSLPDSRTLKNKPENSDNFNSTPQKVGHGSRSRIVELSKPMSSKDENILSKAVDEYFTTGNPSEATTTTKYSEHRSDVSNVSQLPETVKNFTSSNFDRNLQETTEQQNLFHSGISSQQIRLRNVLRNYKPDQIIIDVENIPTQRPPESTLGFQGQIYFPNSNNSPNLSRNANAPKSEQTSGDTWRGRPISKSNLPSRKTHNLQAASKTFQKHRRNETNPFQHRVHDNNVRQLIYPIPQTLLHPAYNTHGSYKLDSLPPGVSIHPRHPNAPYADAVHSKVLQPIHQGHSKVLQPFPQGHSKVLQPVPQGRTPKLHRQRHHKKKDRSLNSCCRARGKAKNCCGSCCRGKSLHTKPSCCSSIKSEQRQRQVRIATPQQVRKLVEDPRDRCQKERLCRTLYESTQQVMVCRNAKIEGC